MKTQMTLAALALALPAAVASADVTLDHTIRSNVRSNGGTLPGSYAVRWINSGAASQTLGPPVERERNFHTFDLSQLSGNITAATLRVWVDFKDGDPGSGIGNQTGAPYQSSESSETVNLFDVSTASSVLTGAPDAAAFADLGTGNQYGSFVVNDTDANVYIDVPLSAQAVADLNAVVGTGDWSVGGALVANGSYGANSNFISERVLHDDNIDTNDLPAQLVLTGTVVPEPASLTLLAIGGILAVRRRR